MASHRGMQTMPAQGHRTGRGFVTSFAEDRICARPECATKLSRYNAQELCGVHEASAQRHRAL